MSLVPSLAATLPAITYSVFECSAALGSLSESCSEEDATSLKPALFSHRMAAARYLENLHGPRDLQQRIDYMVGTLQAKQAQAPQRCVRAFSDYVVNRSLPARLCHVVQRLDLAWISHAMTYLGNKMLDYKIYSCGVVCQIFDWNDYLTQGLEAHKSLKQIEDCQDQLEELSGNSQLFYRYHQIEEPLANSTLIEPHQLPSYNRYFGIKEN